MKAMWNLTLVNQTQARIQKKKLEELSVFLQKILRLKARKDADLKKRLQTLTAEGSLTCVFLESKEMKRINFQFRGKNKVTDVLSFESPEGLGELLFCLDQIKLQASEQGHSAQDELSYMFIHGVLHLLGYDHELSQTEEVKMFALQDAIFAKWRK